MKKFVISFLVSGCAVSFVPFAEAQVAATGKAQVSLVETAPSCQSESDEISKLQAAIAQLKIDIAKNDGLLAGARATLAGAEKARRDARDALDRCKTDFPPTTFGGQIIFGSGYYACVTTRSQALNTAGAAVEQARNQVNYFVSVALKLQQALEAAQAALSQALINLAMCEDPDNYELWCESVLWPMQQCAERGECSPEVYELELENCLAGEPSVDLIKGSPFEVKK